MKEEGVGAMREGCCGQFRNVTCKEAEQRRCLAKRHVEPGKPCHGDRTVDIGSGR